MRTCIFGFNCLTVCVVALLATAIPVHAGHVPGGPASPTYSIDFQGPTAGIVNAGDILTPVAPGVVSPPAVVIPFTALGITPLPVGAPPTIADGHAELDALSYGLDYWIQDNDAPGWQFSVDEFAIGLPGKPGPSVTTEGALAVASREASADVFGSTPPVPGPIGPPGFIPPAVGGTNIGLFDGNGTAPFAAPGLNLVEPNAPSAGALPDVGDNLDAWDVDTHVSAPGDPPAALTPAVYYSLDAAFPDPLEVAPANSGTAPSNGVSGADILVSTTVGAPPAVYAAAALLGLMTSQDDVDALVLWETGDGVYQPTTGPYSWLPPAGGGSGTDMLLYSVRRGSFAVGMPDAIFGAPIEEGDILVPVETTPGSGVFMPGIFISAEALGLATLRSGTAAAYVGIPNPDAGGAALWADDLDALDVVEFNIPEPASALLLLVGMALALSCRRRC